MNIPYYAVIFTSVKSNLTDGYDEMALKMVELAQQQEGFLGVESARNANTQGKSSNQIGITVSYWKSLEAIKNWKQNLDHLEAQEKGKSSWYENYTVRIALVEREYGF